MKPTKEQIESKRVLNEYLIDLYRVFLRKVDYIIFEKNIPKGDDVAVQAMLIELIKVKKLIIG